MKKKQTSTEKLEELKKLKVEGTEVEVNVDRETTITVNKVDTEVPETEKVEKEETQSFEDFKEMYKDKITEKCIEYYGIKTDEDLWNDVAQEMYLQQKTYIPVKDKKEETKQINLLQEDNSDFENIQVGDEFINHYGAKIVVLDVGGTEQQFKVVNPKIGKESDVYYTTNIRKVLEVNGYTKVKNKEEEIKQINSLQEDNSKEKDEDVDKFLTRVFLSLLNNKILKDINNTFNVVVTANKVDEDNNNVKIEITGDTMDLLDATKHLAGALQKNGINYHIEDKINNNTVSCLVSPVKTESKKVEEDLTNKDKFLASILDSVIHFIQTNFDVTATAEYEVNNVDKVIVRLKGKTQPLIEASIYLSEQFEDNENVDCKFGEDIVDNIITCTISPKE